MFELIRKIRKHQWHHSYKHNLSSFNFSAVQIQYMIFHINSFPFFTICERKTRSNCIFIVNYSIKPSFHSTYMLFTGQEVRIGKNCARGLEYGPRAQAEGRIRDKGYSFSQYGPTKAGE